MLIFLEVFEKLKGRMGGRGKANPVFDPKSKAAEGQGGEMTTSGTPSEDTPHPRAWEG